MPPNEPWQAALGAILSELIAGPPGDFSFVLNPGDPGLVPLLRSLDADAANMRPGAGRRSIAEHAGHLAYALRLFERWAEGEDNPFATADWAASWRIDVPDEQTWKEFVD
ncbi:MAG: DinB family protein, partial [Planctomycetota bacterium]